MQVHSNATIFYVHSLLFITNVIFYGFLHRVIDVLLLNISTEPESMMMDNTSIYGQKESIKSIKYKINIYEQILRTS